MNKFKLIAQKLLLTALLLAVELTSIPMPLALAQGLTMDTPGQLTADNFSDGHDKLPDVSLAPLQAAVHDQTLSLSLAKEAQAQTSAVIAHHPLVHRLAKKHFRSDEDISLSIADTQQQVFAVSVVDASGKDANVVVYQKQHADDEEYTISPHNQFRPGKYTMIVKDADGNTTSKQDFTWGVLAINTNKSVYLPHEQADLAMAVLNESGNMVCDAKVTLKITHAEPSQGLQYEETLSTDNGKITVNPQCTSHDFTIKPDYEAHYQIGSAGTYTLDLTAQTHNGMYSITDSFDVLEQVPFAVERSSATRIYPPLTYPMNFTVTANEDFDGTVTETVPESFTVTKSDIIQDVSPTTNASPQVLGTTDVVTSKIVSSAAEPQDSVASSSAAREESLTSLTAESLRLPFDGAYPMTQGFGEESTDPLLWAKYKHFGIIGHDGLDYALPMGTPVVAVDGGQVVFAGDGDYGTTIVIQHAWGRTYYGHLSKLSVQAGEAIKRGDQIGLSGNTGLSTGPHLHFGLRPNDFDDKNGYFGKVDPLIYMSTNPAPAVLGITAPIQTRSAHQTTDGNKLTWKVKVKKGETISLSYQYKTPNVSPQFYTLGPLQFRDKQHKLVFQESRQWQIAADASWYNSSWGFRKAITIDHTKVTATQSNFPVLVNLSSDANLSANARSDGFDILFTASDGTSKVPAERELYTNGTGALVMWVKVSSLSNASDTVIYMYYGNPSSCDQSASGCDGTNNSTGVWDTNYKSVWHLGDVSATTTIAESTSNAHSTTKTSSHPVQGTGQMGNAQTFTAASSEFINANTTAASIASGNHTWEFWFKPTNTFNSGSSEQQLVALSNSSSSNDSFVYLAGGSGSLRFQIIGSGGPVEAVTTETSWTAGTWYYVTAVFSTTNGMTLYRNGNSDGTNANKTRQASASTEMDIGRRWIGSYFNGTIDEVRVSSSERLSTWVSTSYANENAPGSFYSVGAQECNTSPTNDQLMRHGEFFNACGRQAFTF